MLAAVNAATIPSASKLTTTKSGERATIDSKFGVNPERSEIGASTG